jgi:redox-sensing transcriptional repressor
MALKKISGTPTIRRLPAYKHIVEMAHLNGDKFISGSIIAKELDLEPIQVRKDLSVTGIAGRPGIGYSITELLKAIKNYLDWDVKHEAVIVGAGNLGSALFRYEEFEHIGLFIRALFDIDPAKIGKKIFSSQIYHLSTLKKLTALTNIEIAILTVPTVAAQEATQYIVDAGIKVIWNFTKEKIKVPDRVLVQKDDVLSGFAELSFKMKMLHSA